MLAFVAGSVVALAAVYLYDRFGRHEVATLLSDLDRVATNAVTFAENKALQAAEHLEEAALQQKHASLKQADAERGRRIAAKINELLNG